MRKVIVSAVVALLVVTLGAPARQASPPRMLWPTLLAAAQRVSQGGVRTPAG
jgi:hypothetical protein